MWSIVYRFFLILGLAGALWWWYSSSDEEVVETIGFDPAVTVPEGLSQEFSDLPEVAATTDETKEAIAAAPLPKDQKIDSSQIGRTDLEQKSKITHKVPFIVQAPKGQWEDVRFQDACEEASLLMAALWASDEGSLSKNEATEELEKVFDFVEENFAPGVIDTSAADTLSIYRGYFGRSGTLIEEASLQDIYDELAAGNLVIAPTDGKALDNKYFSNGGPDRHMLVITGYNKDKDLFITNDPGTKRGEDFEYDTRTLYNAIRDYDTGHKGNIIGRQKNIISITK